MDDQPLTHYFAPEIERSTVSILWREPERLSGFLRDCDPVTHLTQPHLRTIVQAINLAYSELGTADFASVVQTVREMNELDNVGGVPMLNEVFTAAELTPQTGKIFEHYVGMLNRYAENRKHEPIRPLYNFVGGKGCAYPVKTKHGYNRPDFSGRALIDGKMYQMNLFVAAQGEYVNARFEPPTR